MASAPPPSVAPGVVAGFRFLLVHISVDSFPGGDASAKGENGEYRSTALELCMGGSNTSFSG